MDIWSGEQWGHAAKTAFDLARKALNSKVESIALHVLDLAPDKVGVFDVVFFFGVLYHMRHPLLALERVFSITGKQLFLETHIERLGGTRPAMVFYPGTELNNDPSNWWGPNPAAVEAMLETAGFRKAEKFREYPSRIKAGLRHDIKRSMPFLHNKDVTRAVFHAWR